MDQEQDWRRSSESHKIHEGLLEIDEKTQTILEKSISLGQQLAQVDISSRNNTASIIVLTSQVMTIASKGEVTSRFMERLDDRFVFFAQELAGLKREVTETKSVVLAIAEHLGLKVGKT